MPDAEPLTGTQRANLLLALLVTQILRVLPLAGSSSSSPDCPRGRERAIGVREVFAA